MSTKTKTATKTRDNLLFTFYSDTISQVDDVRFPRTLMVVAIVFPVYIRVYTNLQKQPEIYNKKATFQLIIDSIYFFI